MFYGRGFKTKMIMNELDYFRLKLVKYMKEEFPHLLSDEEFITIKAKAAARACSEAIISGEANNPDEGIRIGLNTLFEDLQRTDYGYSAINEILHNLNPLEKDEHLNAIASSLVGEIEVMVKQMGLDILEGEEREEKIQSLIQRKAKKHLTNGL